MCTLERYDGMKESLVLFCFHILKKLNLNLFFKKINIILVFSDILIY